MVKTRIPLTDRTFARSKGCWNCMHAGDPTVGLTYWKTHARPRDELRVKFFKEQLAAVPANDTSKYAKAKRSSMLKVIEDTTRVIDAFEKAIDDGMTIRCTSMICKDPGEYKSHRFLCDQWSGKPGASLAQSGAPKTADMLPGELHDRFGDGN